MNIICQLFRKAKTHTWLFINYIIISWIGLLASGCSRISDNLKEGIYFAIGNHGLHQLQIKKDTLNFIDCIDTLTCQGDIKYQYKIRDAKRAGNAYLLYVETLRFLNTFRKAPDNYQVISLAYSTDDRSIEVIKEATFYKSLDESKKKGTYNPGNKFPISFYTPAYLREVSTYPAITTIDSAALWNLKKSLVREAIRNKEAIRNTNTGDAYLTETTRELFNRALIQQELNPLVNKTSLDSTLRKLKQQYSF